MYVKLFRIRKIFRTQVFAGFVVFSFCVKTTILKMFNDKMFNSIFDELKESNRFQEFYNLKYFNEIKRLKNLQKAEPYLEPKRASTMELL